jgi:hypothetical protein
MEEAVAAGEDAMYDRIDTSGNPGKTWPTPTPGHWENSGKKTQPTADRVDTGLMRKSVSSRVFVSAKNSVTGEVGWTEGSEEYFMHQEYGFKHAITGEVIEGMMALRAARETTQDVFRDRVEREIERHFKK